MPQFFLLSAGRDLEKRLYLLLCHPRAGDETGTVLGIPPVERHRDKVFLRQLRLNLCVRRHHPRHDRLDLSRRPHARAGHRLINIRQPALEPAENLL